MNKIKKWNWSGCFIIILICLIGAMGNENCKTLEDSFILGIVAGCVFGLPIAIISKEE